jgi:hypothetical protein
VPEAAKALLGGGKTARISTLPLSIAGFDFLLSTPGSVTTLAARPLAQKLFLFEINPFGNRSSLGDFCGRRVTTRGKPSFHRSHLYSRRCQV